MTADAADEPRGSQSAYERPTPMTSAMLKALANPLRRSITNMLNRLEHARAADLAEQLDVAANTISFHLRVLADAGLIEEAPEFARDRRDRVWRPRKIGLELGSPEHPIQDEDEIAGAAFTRLLVDEHNDLVRRFISWVPEYTRGRDDVARGTLNQLNMKLTRAEFIAVMEKINRALEDAKAAHDPADPDSHYWQIDIVAADDSI
ncbi:helix-turn-helix domain-containing protein [Microbacterium sp. KUDC0406]|uniref:ArsR/SmtB family transcription factor n=1 Tax=Microbacterium sp. KUDC0406 TaxID=2909588 RepID=UPI001F43C971|nr:helix-turn-helix domain-containing protein [Microbacterium sp. KUDC0406]UJP09433.1 helix-turn-helix domain-containing protein [Microbacterium sp. KUDC0406]